jgi:PAS domain S-box-containing protein
MKHFLKRIFVLWVSLIILSPLIAQKQTTVTLQLKWKHQFQFAGYYAAIEKGFYKDAGLEVNLLEAMEGQNPSEAVFDGRAEFGVSTSDILIMRSQGKKAVVLANIFQHSPQILLTTKKSGIQHVHDLIGKRIAMEPNAADIIAFLNDEGITTGKYIIDQHAFNADKLINGEIDGISAYSTDEPFELQEANFEYTIISPSMGGIDFYGDGLFTTEALIKKDPLLVENFRAASLKGWKYAMENPEEIVNLIYEKYSQRHSREHLRFEADRMKNLIMPNVVEIGYSNPGRWESIGNTYKKLKMIDVSFSTEGMFYAEYLKPKLAIPWRLIAGFLLILLILASITYFFYNVSRKLKNEIKIRMKIEKKLVESEEHYRSLVENSPDAVIIYKDEKIVFVNKECLRLMRAGSTDELTGKPVLQFVHPDYQALVIGRMITAASSGETLPPIEEKLIRIDGSEVFVEVKAIPIQLLNKPAVQLIIHDLTGRKVSEIALQESEKKFTEMADLLPQIVFESDLQGKLVYVNKQASKVLGYPGDYDIGGLNTINLYIPEDRPRAIENIKRRMMGQRDESNEYTMIRFDGSLINVLVYSNPIFKETKPVGLRGIIIDITDRKVAEEAIHELNITLDQRVKERTRQLQEVNKKLEFQINEIEQFAYITTHDLTEPLVALTNFTNLLHEEYSGKLDEAGNKSIDFVFHSATRMRLLLKNLFDYSLLGKGSVITKVDCKKMVIGILDDLTPFVKENNATIILQELPEVDGYPKELGLLFRHLICNAIKFHKKEISPEIKISAENQEKEWLFSFEDNGIGIKEKEKEKIFMIFQRMVRRDEFDGTGIGLAHCKKIVELHGGRIWLESNEHGGSTFRFTIPVYIA